MQSETVRQAGFLPRRKINVGPWERVVSFAGGSLLILKSYKYPMKISIPSFLGGSYLIYRGISGNCLAYQLLEIERAGPQGSRGIEVSQTITINRPRQEVYRFWRDFENLPNVMQHIESVEIMENHVGKISHWVAKAPFGRRIEWEAELFTERENEAIAWRSLPGSFIQNFGEIRFEEAPGNRGTEVRVHLIYNPPGGSAGAAFAHLFGEEPSRQIAEDLRRFKQIMETGEIPTVIGQTSARLDQTLREREEIKIGKQKDVVEIASEESFPASDPPAFTNGEQQEVVR